MKTRAALIFGTLALVTIAASLVDAPIEAACCYGRLRAGGPCGPLSGPEIWVGNFTTGDPTYDCAAEASDTLGVAKACVISRISTSPPLCY